MSELPEFNRGALEVLRQPLEDGVSRVSASYIYPADFCLVVAMNPCPCGYYGDVYRQCSSLDRKFWDRNVINERLEMHWKTNL